MSKDVLSIEERKTLQLKIAHERNLVGAIGKELEAARLNLVKIDTRYYKLVGALANVAKDINNRLGYPEPKGNGH